MINLNRRKVVTPDRSLPAPAPGKVVAMPIELLTVREAATFARASQPTVRRWIREEGLRAHRSKKRGRIRIDKTDLIKFLKGEAN